jgi:membrane fusion protein (multidrug efflux system)
VSIVAASAAPAITAEIVAIDARVDSVTRNAMVRARIEGSGAAGSRPTLAPGSSVRVRVPVGAPTRAVSVPVTALRRGPAGDHVFVLIRDENGVARAHQRRVVSGAVLGDEVVIEEGLEAGEEVAVTGSFKLYEGVLVAVAGNSGAEVGADS